MVSVGITTLALRLLASAAMPEYRGVPYVAYPTALYADGDSHEKYGDVR